MELLRVSQLHLEEFWGVPMAFPEGCDVERSWLTRFVELNEERSGGTSLTDLLYVLRCYMLVLANQDRAAEQDLRVSQLHELLTRVKLLGSSSTAKTRAAAARLTADAAAVDALEFRVAAYVVFVFSAGVDEVAAELDREKCSHEHIPADLALAVREARALDFLLKADVAVKEGVAAAPTEDVQPGTWWLGGNGVLAKQFVPMCSRVFHKIHADRAIMARFTPKAGERGATALPEQALHQWLVARSRIELTNDFYLRFRDACYKNASPVHALHAASSRRSARTSRLTSASALFDLEFGFRALSRVDAMASGKAGEVAASRDHEMHDCLLLVMFDFQMYQATKARFIDTFYVGPQQAGFSVELEDLLVRRTKWGMNLRPIIVELGRRLFVLDVSGPDVFERGGEEERGKRVESTECRSMYEALLYWVHLLHTKYKDELVCGTRLHKFYAPFLLDRQQ